MTTLEDPLQFKNGYGTLTREEGEIIVQAHVKEIDQEKGNGKPS